MDATIVFAELDTFKVGDRVMILGGFPQWHAGRVGTITEITAPKGRVLHRVIFDEDKKTAIYGTGMYALRSEMIKVVAVEVVNA